MSEIRLLYFQGSTTQKRGILSPNSLTNNAKFKMISQISTSTWGLLHGTILRKKPHFLQSANKKWILPLCKISTAYI